MTLPTPYHEEPGIRIYHADALDLLPHLEPGTVGAVVTDPPYSSGGAFRGDRAQKTTSKYVNRDTAAYRPFLVWCSLWLNAARQAATPGAPLVSFIDWRQLPTLTDAVQVAGWTWRGVGTWWKPGVRMQRGRFSASSEFVVYGTNGPVDEAVGQASPQSVFACPPVPTDERSHIAQKPVDVLRWALGVAPAGAPVLDPFLGSGATLRAAKDLGHPAIGIDSDERYCERAARGLAQGSLTFG